MEVHGCLEEKFRLGDQRRVGLDSGQAIIDANGQWDLILIHEDHGDGEWTVRGLGVVVSFIELYGANAYFAA
ncbi:hypothetical protein RHMOL_Rhmol06G0074900 [Rhododendron molle]|uniref:Uncharacterized protein n=1 Tax=Rhododendron molle TaxID=49168 RepID=A0ACC0NA53_RHOML|nr:hypothetical protein RHMOL_Rhmol06G0074900 [Rhododendron molle]